MLKSVVYLQRQNSRQCVYSPTVNVIFLCVSKYQKQRAQDFQWKKNEPKCYLNVRYSDKLGMI